MNFLPLADRELRITARKARTYWLRSAIALGTMAMGTVFIVLGFSRIISPSSAGKAFFESLSVALYVGVTLDTLTAAGSLGRERRENTLGFLFLTPLKGYDVVAGKLAGVLVHQFYALLATLPVMSISFFIGGVSGSDFMRMAIALLNALFFSSTLGLLTGAFIQRESRAVGGAVAMSVLFCLGLPRTRPASSLHCRRKRPRLNGVVGTRRAALAARRIRARELRNRGRTVTVSWLNSEQTGYGHGP